MAALPLTEVIGGLYIGNELQAASRLLLIEHNVHYVLNAAGPQVANHFADSDFEYLPLDLFDSTSDNIKQFFDVSYDFIEKSQASGRACLVHCKSGNSRAAAIVMMYLMRRLSAPLKSVYQFVLLRTDMNAKPNNGFLAQMMDYEVELRGESSLDNPAQSEVDTSAFSPESLRLYLGPQSDLDDEAVFTEVAHSVKKLMLMNKWKELEALDAKYRDEDFGRFPLWLILVRRTLYQVVAMQVNVVVEKMPTPEQSTTVMVYNYVVKTQKALLAAFGPSHEVGVLHVLHHAVAHCLSITNVGIGNIFVDHLSSKLGTAYRLLHSGKIKPSDIPVSAPNAHQSSDLAQKISDSHVIVDKTPSTFEDLVDALRKHGNMVFSVLFQYLSMDASLVSYLQQYESSLANRLTLFLPMPHAPTHALLAVEEEIAALLPHPVHVNIVKKMLSDINKAEELSSNRSQARKSETGVANGEVKLEVALLDSAVWPVSTLTKTFDSSEMVQSVNAIPATILPLDVFSAWSAFKGAAEEEGKTLALLPNYGDAQLTATLGGKQYTLEVTTPMMLVLCSFNDDGETQTFAVLRSRLNLPSKLLAQTLFSLSQSSHQILLKSSSSDSQLIGDADTFSLNESFNSKTRRFKIPNLKYPPK